MTGLIVAVLAAGFLYLRLQHGPIRLPGVADLVAKAAGGEAYRLTIGDVVVSLSEGGSVPAIQFMDVEVTSPRGEALMSAPRVAARFNPKDLAKGQIRPTRISLIEPRAHVVRTADGHLRIGLGSGAGMLVEGADEAPADSNPADAVARVIDGLVGDGPLIDELQSLDSLSILGIDVSFRDEVTGGEWQTEGADIFIRRGTDLLTATLQAGLAAKDGETLPFLVTATRRKGDAMTEIDLQFDGLRPEAIQAQIPNVDFANVVDAELSGSVSTSFGRDGTLGDILGILRADDMTITLSDVPVRRFEFVNLAFTLDPAVERLFIETMEVKGPTGTGRVTGIMDLDRADDGAVTGIQSQMDVHRINLDIPEIFSAPLFFDGGQILGQFDFEPAAFTVHDAHLSRGDLIFAVEAHVQAPDGVLVTDLRAAARNMTVDELLAHWPLAAAVNARDWIAEHIEEGLITEVVSHIRVAEGEPQLSLDFTYTGLRSTYLPGMSPVTDARGRGHLTFHDFFLEMDAGQVEPVPGEVLALDGSKLAFYDLWGAVTPADIRLTGKGGIAPILALINQDPLALVGKIGLDPGAFAGEAEVKAAITFPLINALLLEQVEVDVDAVLANVAMPLAVSGRELDVASPLIALSATTSEMSLSGNVRVDGVPLRLDWVEAYGKGPDHREIRASGTVTDDLLAGFGANLPGFRGKADVTLDLAQRGGAETRLALDADLVEAALDPGGLDWRKAAGTPGTLSLTARRAEDIVIDAFTLETPTLSATGAGRISAAGDLISGRLDRLRLDDRLDLSAEVRPAQVGLAISLDGQLLDLAALAPSGAEERGEPASTAPPVPIKVDFNLDRFVLEEGIAIDSAKGTYSHNAAGRQANLTGTFGPAARIEAQYEAIGDAPPSLRLTSPNTGALLKNLDVYDGTIGGNLVLDARIAPAEGVDLAGVVTIEDLQLEDDAELANVLRQARFEEREVEEASNGLTFRSIRIPFSYAGETLSLERSYAKSPSLAVTAQGEVDRGAGKIDVVGAISPAYAVTGALDAVPVLGQILSGGEGEGIFAMTFSMSGSLDDPDLSFNPLSLLTPGFLRNIFSGRKANPDADFMERLDRDDP